MVFFHIQRLVAFGRSDFSYIQLVGSRIDRILYTWHLYVDANGPSPDETYTYFGDRTLRGLRLNCLPA
jgi:hypothetical protein